MGRPVLSVEDTRDRAREAKVARIYWAAQQERRKVHRGTFGIHRRAFGQVPICTHEKKPEGWGKLQQKAADQTIPGIQKWEQLAFLPTKMERPQNHTSSGAKLDLD